MTVSPWIQAQTDGFPKCSQATGHHVLLHPCLRHVQLGLISSLAPSSISVGQQAGEGAPLPSDTKGSVWISQVAWYPKSVVLLNRISPPVSHLLFSASVCPPEKLSIKIPNSEHSHIYSVSVLTSWLHKGKSDFFSRSRNFLSSWGENEATINSQDIQILICDLRQ